MSLLGRYDPPGFLSDFNTIPGQLDAWHQAVSGWFDAVVESESKAIGAAPQFYNAARFDPGGSQVEQAITWNAFPKELLRRYGRDRALQLADMLWPIESYGQAGPDPADPAGASGLLYRPQEEYCEWHVLRDPDTNKILRITFTSEPPEYWQALFGSIPNDGGPKVPFPGDRDALLHLYRELVSEAVQAADLVATATHKDATTGHAWTTRGQYSLYNKWNTTHGIAHLNSPPNSLMAEIQLGGDATVRYTDPQGRLLTEPDALICYAGYGGPNRNSDPTIGATVNALARLGAYVTLRNPVGLYMDHIDLGGWSAPDGGDLSEFVRLVRGTPGMIERMVVEAPPGRKLTVGDLAIAGTPIRFGGQVAECITVKLVGIANVLANPVTRPAVGNLRRGYLDPADARVLGSAGKAPRPLPPGTIEAFLGQGAAAGAAQAGRRTAKSEPAPLAARLTKHSRPVHRSR
jgi:hypothetical protein